MTSCPAAQYRRDDGTCQWCGENEWSAEGDNECSTCPEGTEMDAGPGTSESDCRMVAPEPSSAKSAISTPILVVLGVLAAFF